MDRKTIEEFSFATFFQLSTVPSGFPYFLAYRYKTKGQANWKK